MQESVALTAADRRILDALSRDARQSWVALGRAVNLSPSACQRRVEALQAAGVVRGFGVRTDPRALGLTVHAFVQLRVERQKVERARALRRTVAAYPEVVGAWKLSGAVDYLVEVRVADIAALSAFLDEKLLGLDGVTDASSAIVLDEVARGS